MNGTRALLIKARVRFVLLLLLTFFMRGHDTFYMGIKDDPESFLLPRHQISWELALEIPAYRNITNKFLLPRNYLIYGIQLRHHRRPKIESVCMSFQNSTLRSTWYLDVYCGTASYTSCGLSPRTAGCGQLKDKVIHCVYLTRITFFFLKNTSLFFEKQSHLYTNENIV